VVRHRLTDAAMRRQLDTMDICQSVFGEFFVRMSLGQFDLNESKDIIKLLATMARNRVLHHARRQTAGRRDIRKQATQDFQEFDVAGNDSTPSRIVAGRELVAEFRARMTADERELAEARADDVAWSEIAARRGEKADALRQRLNRAIERVSRELGLETGVSDA
jgi:RNA polymerase sigma-70 factor (ECF subfamily)